MQVRVGVGGAEEVSAVEQLSLPSEALRQTLLAGVVDALELFDFAEPSLVTGQRETTNVPVQALYLMNSPFVTQRANALAARLTREADAAEGRVERAFLLCFSRGPDAEEKKQSLAFLNKQAGPATLASFCQALLCTAEFRNLD